MLNHNIKKTYILISVISTDSKIISKILVSQIEQHKDHTDPAYKAG